VLILELFPVPKNVVYKFLTQKYNIMIRRIGRPDMLSAAGSPHLCHLLLYVACIIVFGAITHTYLRYRSIKEITTILFICDFVRDMYLDRLMLLV
jgi:hypothetical protein